MENSIWFMGFCFLHPGSLQIEKQNTNQKNFNSKES